VPVNVALVVAFGSLVWARAESASPGDGTGRSEQPVP
jgi:hypothetical protein